MKERLSRCAEQIEGQPMFKVLARVQEMEKSGANIIHFEIGDPDFHTPSNIIETACRSLRANETHYTSSMGLRDFRQVIRETTAISRGFMPTMDQVLVTPGANISIYYVVRCLVNPGEEVIIPDPGFPTYTSVLKFCNAVAVPVPLREENQFRMNPDDVRKRITEKTRLIIINSPNNPTGSRMVRSELEAIALIAREHDIYLLSDEVYARLVYESTEIFYSPSSVDCCQERTILSNGFSKAFAMTGWRLGSLIGPEDVIAKMGLLLQMTSSCVSPFIQRAGIEAISGDQSESKVMVDEYKKRRNLLVEGLNSLPCVSCLLPEGAFYVFPNISRTGMTSEEFAEVMLNEASVALLPGTNFGSNGEGHVRLCYAVSRDCIVKGIERMRKVLESRLTLSV